ncbi:MAG: flavodoxin family protein [Lachnospiraceae bacterium]|nr:flavodoxin family protein [Lachnospiraceae bacterium]
MNILILNGSPRPAGNTSKMIEAFTDGLKETGHLVDVVNVCRKEIKGCLACEYCHEKGNGVCIQKDDMQEVYQLFLNADMLVLASPIYYHNFSGQLKCTLDRLYAIGDPKKNLRVKKIAMFLSSGDKDMYEGALFSYKGDFLAYLGLEDMGVFLTYGEEGVSDDKLEGIRKFGKSFAEKENEVAQ